MKQKLLTVLLALALLAAAFYGGYAVSRSDSDILSALFCLDTGG